MDDTTMKLGLLMEAAQAHQKAAESSLKRLKATTSDLAEVVRDEVQRVVMESLHSLESDSKRTCEALRAVRRVANMRVVTWTVAIALLSSAIPFGLAWWLIPSQSDIAALRAKHAELAAKIANLEQQGGRMDLRRCGSGRLCVRVDRKAPMYGEQSDYLIVRGY